MDWKQLAGRAKQVVDKRGGSSPWPPATRKPQRRLHQARTRLSRKRTLTGALAWS